MKKLAVLAAGLLLLVPVLAFPDSLSLRLGYFMPRASTDLGLHPDSLWAIEFDQMSFSMEKYRGTMMGIGYEYFVGKNLSLAFTLDSYSKNRPGYYIDYVQFALDEGDFAFPYEYYDGDIIEHAFSVSSTPLQVSLKLTPLGRKTRLIPFVGGGAGLYFWSVRMYGQMVNFSDAWVYTDPDLGDIDIFPVEHVNGREKGSVFGYHAFAGFQVPIGFRATFEAEARYHWATAKFTEWFQGFEDFDIGGLAITVGFNYWF
jgi:hypothetical protein